MIKYGGHALVFGMARRAGELAMSKPVHAVYEPKWNAFRGETKLEIEIIDLESGEGPGDRLALPDDLDAVRQVERTGTAESRGRVAVKRLVVARLSGSRRHPAHDVQRKREPEREVWIHRRPTSRILRTDPQEGPAGTADTVVIGDAADLGAVPRDEDRVARECL